MFEPSTDLSREIPEKLIQNGPWYLFVDGASRNNPGPAGAGVCLHRGEESVFCEGFFLGSKTNNEAEYIALLLGLAVVQDFIKPGEKLIIISDSELLVRQLQGVYKVKKPELRVLYDQVMKLWKHYMPSIKHVLREKNTCADALANKGIDIKNEIPVYLRERTGL